MNFCDLMCKYAKAPKEKPLWMAPASAKRIVTRYVLPALLVLAIFVGGGRSHLPKDVQRFQPWFVDFGNGPLRFLGRS